MIKIDSQTEQTTLRLRDAFRVLAWQVFETNPEIREDLNQRHTRFYSRWCKHRIHSMSYYELVVYTIKKGFSIEQLLLIREIYYGIHQRLSS